MNIRKRMVGEIAVVALSGGLDSASAPLLQLRLAKILAQHHTVLVDFSKVPCVSSAGLRTMLLLYRQAQGLDHAVCVVGLSAEVRNVLVATGFLDFFVVSDTVADGVVALAERFVGGASLNGEVSREYAASGA